MERLKKKSRGQLANIIEMVKDFVGAEDLSEEKKASKPDMTRLLHQLSYKN